MFASKDIIAPAAEVALPGGRYQIKGIQSPELFMNLIILMSLLSYSY